MRPINSCGVAGTRRNGCSEVAAIPYCRRHASFLLSDVDSVIHLSDSKDVLQCSDDLIAPLEVGYYMHEKTPNSTLKIMNATGHCPHMSAPEETIQLIKAYLDALHSDRAPN